MKRANGTKVNKSQKRRMNALLNIAMIQAVDIHGYSKPEVAQCYNVNPLTDMASFYFDSSAGREVGDGETTTAVWIHEDNTEIIRRLVECIRSVTGYAEHLYRRQVREAARTALSQFPNQQRSILSTAFFLLR